MKTMSEVIRMIDTRIEYEKELLDFAGSWCETVASSCKGVISALSFLKDRIINEQ
jgi:hypothetical protein